MKKCYLTLALLAACAMWGVSPMQAETVSPYTEDFENLVLDPQEDFAPPKWGRIVDAGEDWWGDPDYVDYDNPATGGAADGKAYLKLESRSLTDGENHQFEAKDLLITPAVTGEVRFWLKQEGESYQNPTVRVYTCTANGNSFVQGELLHDYAGEITTTWKEFTLNVEPDTYLGFWLTYAALDKFQAASAEIELKKSMRFGSVELAIASWATIEADETNHITIPFKFTVMNNGDFDLNPGDENYSVSLVNLTSGSPVVEKTVPLDFVLAQGATSETQTIEAEVDATATKMSFALVENVSGNMSAAEELDVLPYLPVLTVHKPGEYDALTTPIDFGVVTDKSEVKVEIHNEGGAPLHITEIKLPEGFTTTVGTPFSVEARGDSLISLTYTATTPGEKTGQVVFVADVIGEQVHDLLATVPEDGVWYEGFEAGTMPGNLIAGADWTIANSPAGLGTTGNTAWAEHTNGNDWSMIITPLLEVREGEVLTFFAGKIGYGSSLEIYYSSDRADWQSVLEIGSYLDHEFSNAYDPEADDYELTRFTVDNIPVGKWYVAFESGNARLDDIYGYRLAPVEQDWYITASDLPDKGTVNHAYTASVTASNLATKAVEAGAYTATLYFNDEAVATAEATAWAAGESKTFEFAYTPHNAGEYTAQVVLASGDYTVQTPEVTVKVAEETASEEIIVGNATASGDTWYNPGAFSLGYKNSGSETIYPAGRLGLENGAKITSVTYLGYAGKTDLNFHVTLWMQNTDAAEFLDATPTPRTELTQVFDQTIQIEEQGSTSDYTHPLMVLQLDEPFVYTGGNLRIATLSTSNDYYGNTGFAIDTEVDKQYAIAFYDDYESNPDYVAWSSYSLLPVIRLTIEKDAFTISGTVTNQDGAPVADATVTLVSGEVIYSGTTDAEGHYNIEVFQPDKDYVLTVTKEGYPEGTAAVSFADGSVVRDIVLGETTGLDAVAAATLVLSAEGRVQVVTPVAGEAVVYSLTGVQVQRSPLAVGNNDLYLAPGSYVVKVNGNAYKVIVK